MMWAILSTDGVGVLPDGHNAGVLFGKPRLDPDSVVDVKENPCSQATTIVAAEDPVHHFVPSRTSHGAAGHLVGEDVLLSDFKLLHDVELCLQVPGGGVRLADLGVAVDEVAPRNWLFRTFGEHWTGLQHLSEIGY